LPSRVAAPHISAHSPFRNYVARARTHFSVALPQSVFPERSGSGPCVWFIFDRIENSWLALRQNKNVLEKLVITIVRWLPEIRFFVNHRIVDTKTANVFEEQRLPKSSQRFRAVHDRIPDIPTNNAAITEHSIQFLGCSRKVPRMPAIRPKLVIWGRGHDKMNRPAGERPHAFYAVSVENHEAIHLSIRRARGLRLFFSQIRFHALPITFLTSKKDFGCRLVFSLNN
jgi:hypothetical protein